jgi:HEAT repeat protein
MDLSNEEAYELWKSTDAEIWLEMLSAEGDLQLVTQRLMSMAKTRVTERRDDADAIRELLRTATSDDIVARMAAIRTLSSEHGEYAVQYMLPSIGDQAAPDRRVLVMNTLTTMGDEVVLPLVAALDSPDAFLRRNVAVVLGYIADPRAAAGLARLAEGDADESVRQVAADSLAACGGTKGAEYAYLVLGNEYHASSMSVLRPDQYSKVVWSFDGGRLVSSEVPRYLYAQELAKGAFYDAMRVQAGSKAALSGLARVYATQMQLISDREAAGLDVGGERAQARAGLLAVAAAGTGAVDAGLNRAVNDGDQMAAIGLCRAVQQGLAVAGDGLTAALKKGDAGLRAEAALALVAQANTAGAPVSAATIGALGEAAGRRIARVVAVIDANAGRAGAVAAALEAEGMLVNHFASGAKGLASVYKVPGLDAILVAESLPDMTCDQVLAELADSSRFGETPVLILAANADVADGLYGDRTAGIVADGDVSAVSGAMSESMGRDREYADALSRRSAAALGALAARGVDVSAGRAGLVAALGNNRPDDVVIPALEALGSVGGADEAAVVAGLCADGSASDAAREAAAMACAAMFSRGVAGDGSLDLLHGVVSSDASLEVRGAAAAALGRLNLSAEMRAELLRLVRVNVGE